MADVRSMLRQQRAARQQASKPPKPSPAPSAAPASKKRKAADISVDEERKRTRTEEDAGVPAGFFDAGASHDAKQEQAQDGQQDANVAQPAVASPNQEANHEAPRPPAEAAKDAPPSLDAAEEAELDAFLNEMKQERPAPRPTQHAGAVIEAAPMTAAELAAQAREDEKAERARRDEEMEGDKEDAARALEDEFEEMESLEERVKRLREQREAVRSMSGQHAAPGGVVAGGAQPEAEAEAEAGADEESESEDEDWDDWKFRPA